MNKNKELFTRDQNRINRYCKDLEAYCIVINELIEKLRSKKLLSTLTDQILSDLAENRTESVKQLISEEYRKEAEFISSAFAKQRFLDGLLDAYVLIDQIVGDFAQMISERSLSLGLSLSAGERLSFLKISDNRVSFDRSKVIEKNTFYLTGDFAQDFIKRSELLFNMIAEYDRDVRLLSHGSLRGISTESGSRLGTDGMICVDDLNTIYLDWRLISQIDFDNAEKLLSSDKQFDNKKICGSLRSES